MYADAQQAQSRAILGASARGAGLAAVPTPMPEIEAEMHRLRAAAERADQMFNDLAGRLHSVRVSEPPSPGAATKEIEPQTPLGQQIRAVSDRIDQIADNVGYHLRTVALPI